MKLRAGIDIGKNGAIVVLENGEIVLKTVTPCIGNQIDVAEIRNIVKGFDRSRLHIVIEDVHAIFGSSAKSTFQFGWSLGVIEGILSGMLISFTKVTPKVWQKEMWQGVQPVMKQGVKSVDTKTTSLIAAKRLFPDIDLRKSGRSEKPHDGIVDALLMAEYCRRRF